MTYTIVVGIDGSAHGDAALRWALAEAEAHDDGRVTALFSWQLPFVGFPAPSTGRNSSSLRCAASAPCPVTLVKLQAEEPKV
jgi:hypothetical protein